MVKTIKLPEYDSMSSENPIIIENVPMSIALLGAISTFNACCTQWYWEECAYTDKFDASQLHYPIKVYCKRKSRPENCKCNVGRLELSFDNAITWLLDELDYAIDTAYFYGEFQRNQKFLDKLPADHQWYFEED